MKSIFTVLMMASISIAQQFNSGMNSSIFGQNCGASSNFSMQMPSQTSMQRQGSQANQKTNKEDLAEIKSLNKEKSQKKKELMQAQRELQNFDSKLRNLFDSSSYEFIKEHFDGDHHCQDYKGYAEQDKTASLSFPISKMSTEWPQLCDVENNLQGQLKSTVCSKAYLMRSSDSSCANVISKYPVTKHNVDNLKKEIEDIEAQVSSLKESMKAEQDSDGANGGLGVDSLAKDSSETEGGVCLECMNRNSSSGGRPSGSGSNLFSLLSNSAMAFVAYNSTNDFYSNMADKNANLGFPTAMSNTSPFMAASPYLLNVLGQGAGSGNSNCGNPYQSSGMQTMGGMQSGSGMQSNLGLQFGAGLQASSGLQMQMLGLNQRLPYLQSPNTINSSLYYGSTGLNTLNTGLNSSYGYSSLYGR